MRKVLLSSVVAMALVGAGAGVFAQPADAGKSQVRFVFTQMNVPVEGQFKKFMADVKFDPAKPAEAKVDVSIDLTQADAGSPDANDALKTKDWFDTARFPQAKFTAAGFKPVGGDKFQAVGQLNLKGRAANVTVPFTVKTDGHGQWLEGVFPLSRTAYKVGEGEWSDTGMVADNVQVKFKLFVPK
ncbi:YceI family protein [Parachitinimonas caeni]|uniref:YceI family protein n=1 Tax=Parachitinimonas caeni TaxID=3031301 RepID=A0ABT7DTB3_9NEIS|nr:YceI family protein [Parachitinimonas caeni]MDK2123209.1 YceI family protein [Parachitinimonas caeni]